MQNLEALYVVEFGDVLGGVYRNGGVVVLETNRIFGGDSGYYYLGSFTPNGSSISAELRVVRHNLNIPSVWGDNAQEFSIRLEGVRHGGVIEGRMVRADRPGIQLPVRLTRKADLP
ncbi:MAG TPA: GrlR family regulatory protein [Alphaproteobacteria bacterium]|nr:GrlR family regulatory protein [Alphaproteobacteria bacterium]